MKTKLPTNAYDIDFSNVDNKEGWAFGRPVGINTVAWPRSRTNGLPMAHLWTFLVPEEYRVKGADYVAVSLFQADDHVASIIEDVSRVIIHQMPVENKSAQPFWDSLLQYATNRHPMEVYLEDIIGGGWALIWLTQKEFDGELTAIPSADQCTFPSYQSMDGTSAFQADAPAKYVRMTVRENDPNVGKKLEDFPKKSNEDAYIGIFSDRGQKFDLEKRFLGKTHFGGTANPVQATPAFSPFYLEFEEAFGEANMGGENGQIDLLNDEIDWACG